MELNAKKVFKKRIRTDKQPMKQRFDDNRPKGMRFLILLHITN
jgi:hypothetical protein